MHQSSEMKFILNLTLFSIIALHVRSQNNHVFGGGELLNYGTIDISSIYKIGWSSDRERLPGYFSVIDNGRFIGYSDEANINGYVKKYGNRPFLFPVGTGKDLRTLEITAPKRLSDAYAVAWIEGDPSHEMDQTSPHIGAHPVTSILDPIKAVSNVGQWDWQVGDAGNLGNGATGDGSDLGIHVSIPDMQNFAEASALRLVGWNGSQWIDLSGTSTANGNTEDSQLSGKMIAGITALAIGKVATYNNDEHGSFLLYPNPVTNFDPINVRFKSSYNGFADIIVYDAVGKTVIKNLISFKAGVNLIPIDVKKLPHGNYYLNIIASNGDVIARGKKFIKQ